MVLSRSRYVEEPVLRCIASRMGSIRCVDFCGYGMRAAPVADIGPICHAGVLLRRRCAAVVELARGLAVRPCRWSQILYLAKNDSNSLPLNSSPLSERIVDGLLQS